MPKAIPLMQERKHFNELDSLRGLAALIVMLHHWNLLSGAELHSKPWALALQLPILKLLINPRAAVMMFFVLSGFVLSLPQVRGKPVNYSAYLVKRICRIYLPYLVALAVALLACWRFHGLDAYRAWWFTQTWHSAPQWRLVVQHLLFLGNYDDAQYNTAFWTLVQEMRISIIFPFVCALVLRMRVSGGLVCAGLLLAIDVVLERYSILPETYAATFAYTGVFIFGILLARYRAQLQAWLGTLSPWMRWSLFAICITIFSYGQTIVRRLPLHAAAEDAFVSIGAGGIIIYCLADHRIGRLLLGRRVLFLGRISYSMYLLHGTVLFLFAYIFYNRISPVIWLVPYLVTTILLAALMYKAVEVPSIALGKSMAARFGDSKG